MDLSRQIKWLKPPIFLLCLGPLGNLVWKFYEVAALGGDQLGANPAEYIRNSLGTWTLIFLCITLGITPARRLLRQNWLIRFRRMLGLFASFYGCLHLVTYVWFDTGFDWGQIVADVYRRPFITAGFTSWVLMIPLAITSTAGMVRRLGGKGWQRLHRLTYFAAIAGVVHYYWLVKSDETVPLRFAYIIGALLAYRVVHYFLDKRRHPPSAKNATSKPSTVSV